jgi:L-rhamnose mutarotase
MERVGFKMFLLEGSVPEYQRRHDEIWPELSQLLTAHGIHNYSIFLDESRLELFAVLFIEDVSALDELRAKPVMQKWWQYMKDLMKTNADGSPITIPLKEVFYLP